MPRPHPALSSGRPQVFAHRGGAALRPENTLAAFDHGLALGADGLEFDVQLSRDGVVVVHHDRTVDRTTDGRGPIAALTAAELARLDAGYYFSNDPTNRTYPFRGLGISVPTLAEVLGRYRDKLLIVELKTNDTHLAYRTIDEIRGADALSRVAIGAFGTRVLRATRAYEPRIVTGSSRGETRLALYRSWINWPVGDPPYDAFQVPEFSGSTRVVSPRFIRYAHNAGVAVQMWTINDADEMRRLLEWGADGIISDRPDVAVDVVRSFSRRAPV